MITDNMKVSVVIPSNKERFLQSTINDLLIKAAGPIEIIVILDGYWPDPPLTNDPRVIVLHRPEVRGMRAAINDAAELATGIWLMKSDAHCMFNAGFDNVLKESCHDNMIMVPRRYSLDAENWCILDNKKAPVDYHYLSYPYAKPEEIGMHGLVWKERATERRAIVIDEEMSSQGSCWIMRYKHWQRLGGMSEVGYGTFVQEAQELFNKTWLGGGVGLINKNTWYAHLHKGKQYGRGYFISKGEMVRGAHYSADYWLKDRWGARKHDWQWFLDRFNPPGWPIDWKAGAREWNLNNKTGLLEKVA